MSGQDSYLEKLKQVAEGSKPILCCNWYEDKRQREPGEKKWKLGKWVPLSQASRPIDHRTVLANELVFDIDGKKWETTKEFSVILKKFLDDEKIPYVLADSGGKGLHFEVFFQADVPNDFMDNVIRAKKHGFTMRQLRIALWRRILTKAGISDNFIGKGNVLDESCVNFDDDGNGHVIRMFGGRKLRNESELGNAEWGFKTLLTDIPERKKIIDNLRDIVFPEKIELWIIPQNLIREIVNEYLLKTSYKSKEEIERKIQKYEGLYTRLPCVQRLIQQGNDEGQRHDGAGKVALACALDKLPNDKTLDILKQYKKACDDKGGLTSFSIEELKSWVEWYRRREGEIYWDDRSCTVLRDVFKLAKPEECTDCPLKKQFNPEALAFLTQGNVIPKIQEQFEHEMVNEKENRMLLFFCYCSAYLKHRIHPKLSGASSIGKSYLLNKVLSFIPSEDVLEKLTSASSKYFNYALTQNPNLPKVEKDGIMVPNIDGKILVVQEFEGAQDAIVTLRPLMSGDQDGINVGIIEKGTDTDQNEHKNMIAVGTPVFAAASTNFSLDKEYLTRVWELELDDSQEQTRAVMNFEGYEDIDPGCHVAPLKSVVVDSIRLLKGSITNVINPFSVLLSNKMPTSREFVRLRRDFKKIKEFIKIVAWLNQFQRPKINIDGNDFILATLEDYQIIKQLIQPSFKMIFTGSKIAKEVYNMCEKYDGLGEEISASAVAREFGWGNEKARKILNLLESKAFLTRKDPERGRQFTYTIRRKSDIEFPDLTMDDLKKHYEELKDKGSKSADILSKILD